MVVRILCTMDGIQKGQKNSPGDVLRVTDTDTAAESAHAGAVDPNSASEPPRWRNCQNGDRVEGIDYIATASTAFSLGVSGFTSRTVQEAREPVGRGLRWARRRWRAGLGVWQRPRFWLR